MRVIVDLEMNHIYPLSLGRKICSMETIEIGAVMLDDNLCEVDSFKTYVKPRYNEEISSSVAELTGITMEQLMDAPDFTVAIKSFADFCLKAEGELKIYAWSGADYGQITHEMKLKGYKKSSEEEKVFGEWYDFQKAFGTKAGYNRPLALADALKMANVTVDGRLHDALDDARNTAELFRLYKAKGAFKDAFGI